MALAETARLVAELVLLDKFSGPANKAQKQLTGMEAASLRAAKGVGFFGNTISTALGIGLQRAVSGGISLLSSQIQQGVQGAEKLETVTTATNQVIASTKGAAGISADAIRALALKYEDLNAVIDDKVIQSGENLLLTFSQIPGKAFEPALQAALNLNQALGGGEEGLQGTIIQVGKALNDPVRGLTSLRRVGVSFSADQEKQIKALVKQNDLYGAQQIILGELSKEFGGQFAKAGQTSTAQAARLRDAVDDLRIGFAQGLLPGINNVRDALIKTFRDPATQSSIAGFGRSIGEFLTPARIQEGIGFIKDSFKAIVGFAKAVPWQAIGTALQIGGAGAKAILTAFAQAPPWLQTAIATGWGLNKLTGGAITGIFGQLASGLIKGVLGINAGVVNINAATVSGGIPGAGAATATGGLSSTIVKFLGLATVAGLGVAIGSEIAASLNAPTINPAKASEQTAFDKFIASSPTPAQIQAVINSIDEQTSGLSGIVTGLSNLPLIGDALGNVGPKLDEQKAILQGLLDAQKKPPPVAPAILAEGAKQSAWRARSQAQLAALGVTSLAGNSIASRTAAGVAALQGVTRQIPPAVAVSAARTAAHLSRLEGLGSATAANTLATARKPSSFNIVANVSVASSFSVTALGNQLTHISETVSSQYGGKIVPLNG